MSSVLHRARRVCLRCSRSQLRHFSESSFCAETLRMQLASAPQPGVVFAGICSGLRKHIQSRVAKGDTQSAKEALNTMVALRPDDPSRTSDHILRQSCMDVMYGLGRTLDVTSAVQLNNEYIRLDVPQRTAIEDMNHSFCTGAWSGMHTRSGAASVEALTQLLSAVEHANKAGLHMTKLTLRWLQRDVFPSTRFSAQHVRNLARIIRSSPPLSGSTSKVLEPFVDHSLLLWGDVRLAEELMVELNEFERNADFFWSTYYSFIAGLVSCSGDRQGILTALGYARHASIEAGYNPVTLLAPLASRLATLGCHQDVDDMLEYYDNFPMVHRAREHALEYTLFVHMLRHQAPADTARQAQECIEALKRIQSDYDVRMQTYTNLIRARVPHARPEEEPLLWHWYAEAQRLADGVELPRDVHESLATYYATLTQLHPHLSSPSSPTPTLLCKAHTCLTTLSSSSSSAPSCASARVWWQLLHGLRVSAHPADVQLREEVEQFMSAHHFAVPMSCGDG